MEELKSLIGSEIFQRLTEANINSLEHLLSHDALYIQDATSLAPKDVQNVIHKATCIILGNDFTTGCEVIDCVLRGGIPVNGITEIVGCGGVGKTQLCLQLSLMTQLHQNENRGVIYISTEKAFPSRRLVQMAEMYRSKFHCQSRFEDNIFIDHIADYQQLCECLYVKVFKLLNIKRIGLIIIDSIAGIFRSENDEISYVNRSQDFITIATQLNKICDMYKVAIVCINQVTESIVTGTTEPCLGLAWSNLITCRFGINRYGEQRVREFEIVFAPDLPDRSCHFKITEFGLLNV